MPRGVFKRTKEHNRRNSEASKSHYRSDCQCVTCQQKRGELKLSEETRRKISEAHKGIKHSEEHGRNIGLAQLGKNSDYPNGSGTYFRELSRKVWEKHYGVKIPIDKRTGKSMPIHHRDFNYKNLAWWNLGLLSYKVHNRIHAQYEKFKKWLKELKKEEK